MSQSEGAPQEVAAPQRPPVEASLEVENPGSTPSQDLAPEPFKWGPRSVVVSISLFVLAAALEVGGGWLVWQSIRETRAWWWGLLGSTIVILYGFSQTLQPTSNFGRIFAIYGGFFIVYSYGWGWALDGHRPDTGQAPHKLLQLVKRVHAPL